MIDRAGFAYLTGSVPNWFQTKRTSRSEIIGTAVVPVSGGSSDYIVELSVGSSGRKVYAREVVPRRLPAKCPNRHINADSSFCIGYGFEHCSSIDEAKVWWETLREYLLLQRVAERTRRWPEGHSIAHGDAAPYHMAARKAAASLGITAAYDRAVAGGDHWATNDSIRLDDRRKRLRNGRLPCPMMCPGRRGRPLLRRECCHPDDVYSLIANDKARRHEEEQFWREMLSEQFECCGTLDDCPLSQRTTVPVPSPSTPNEESTLPPTPSGRSG